AGARRPRPVQATDRGGTGRVRDAPDHALEARLGGAQPGRPGAGPPAEPRPPDRPAGPPPSGPPTSVAASGRCLGRPERDRSAATNSAIVRIRPGNSVK